MSGAEVLAQQLVNGLTLGSVIALVAIGYTMVYGIIGLINFAHGDLYMLGAFAALSLIGVSGLAPGDGAAATWGTLAWVLVLVMAFTGGLNVLIERWAYRPLRRAQPLAPLITAIGVSFILQNLGMLWGALPLEVMGTNAVAPKSFPDLIPRVDLLSRMGLATGVRVTTKDLFVMGLTVPLMLGLHLFVTRTRLGTAMRATSQNREAARMVGIPADRVIAVTFLIGGALAGAGALVRGLFFNTIVFNMGYGAGLQAFTAAVVGGIGSIPGAMLGGLLIGLISALSDHLISARWTPAVLFLILIAVLVFRPRGLLGDPTGQKA
ncbi:MAG: branched-chain amino acid ABC transporter permease [Planctomycetes bacterium]|nr:branched-chain amino acid ABC transporter permease [Planctomycetota bacterium]